MPGISARRMYIRFVKSVFGAYFHFYHHLRIEGTEYIPDHGPLFATINHVSFLEPFALGIAMVERGVYPGIDIWTVAKKELFESPPLASFFRTIGFFPIDREHSDMPAMRTMLNFLRQNKMIAVAPEGTRSPTGQLQEFQPVLAKIAVSRHIPILPVAASGAERAMPVGSPIPRPIPITLRFGPVFELSEFYDRPLTEEQVARAACVMRAHVAELLPEWMRELPPRSPWVEQRER